MRNSETFTKKIVAGKFKGKSLKLPSKETTRSSKMIVVESFFNTIQFDVIDCTMVEVFSGSGSIGLEALSRGAKRVIFMEKDSDAIRALRHNISLTDPKACEVVEGNSFVNIAQVKKRLETLGEAAFIYIDPPFSIREGFEDVYEKTLGLINSLNLSVAKLIVIEHMTGLELPEHIGMFSLYKSKKFGKTSLSYYA
jgi:16S rRNA (guanine(966)-N(2))-methyltransferase RsmD